MSMQPTDEAIMVAVRRADVDQLEILYRRYREPLYDFFSRLTGNRVASEDLVQDVFVRILKYRNTYNPSNRFVTWMYQIGRNARADYLRKYSASSTASNEEHAVGNAREVAIPSRQFEESEEKALLERALMCISESNRELLILARFQEMEYEDLAEVYGISAGALKTRVYRATNELREVYLKLRGNRSLCNATKSVPILPTT
jgi:RNA polymerase sigma-70 factor (ECF subfamily)